MYYLTQVSFKCHAAFNALGYQFFNSIFHVLEVTVTTTLCHRSQRSHAAVLFEFSAFVNNGIAWTFFCSGKYTSHHNHIGSGREESPGDTIIYEGRKFKQYRGMGSLGAMSQGSGDRYFQDVEDEIKKFVPEGIEGRVPFKGSLSEIVYQFVGGLRSGMGYCGADSIKALQQAQFV